LNLFFLIDKLHHSELSPISEEERKSLLIVLAIYISFIANFLLFGINLFAAIYSKSIAIVAAALDSFLDILCTSILSLTNYIIKKKNPYKYPSGKDRLEPLGIIILSTCMSTLTIQLQIEGIELLSSGHALIDLRILSLILISVSIGVKVCLFLFCRLIKNSASVAALTQDHRNDIIVNSTGVGFALLGNYVKWWLDPVGGMLIGLYIMINWFQTGKNYVKLLMGKSANPSFLQQLTYLASTHDERIIQIDTVRAFHLGLGYMVEVDIVLPKNMTVQESHDIAESLQIKLEQIASIERAFVHIDYETTHKPEHSDIKQKLHLDL
jgi:cation diffusion facilitator family transporter